MPDLLPEEAVRAAAEAMRSRYVERFPGPIKPVEQFEDDVRYLIEAAAPAIRADERRKVAEEITAEINRFMDPRGLASGPRETEAYRNGLRLAARIARKAGEARAEDQPA